MGNHETTPKQFYLFIEQKGLRERVSETERERERERVSLSTVLMMKERFIHYFDKSFSWSSALFNWFSSFFNEIEITFEM